MNPASATFPQMLLTLRLLKKTTSSTNMTTRFLRSNRLSNKLAPPSDTRIHRNKSVCINHSVKFQHIPETKRLKLPSRKNNRSTIHKTTRIISIRNPFRANLIIEPFPPQRFPLGPQLFNRFLLIRNVHSIIPSLTGAEKNPSARKLRQTAFSPHPSSIRPHTDI